MPAIVVIILLIVNIPAYFVIGRIVFGGLNEFGDAFQDAIKGEFWSWIGGRGLEYEWAHLRFGAFFLASGILIFGEYKIVMFGIEKLTGA